ncbi:MAG: class I SAM-dependent methyltransferase [Pseudomonadota bacterium]
MDRVVQQYEALPYPERNPADEATRLIEGSPSHPVEIDHYVFGGQRDWRAPFRALVAGGGTGDGLIMLAQKLSDIGCPAEITYLDLSRASRSVAEARAAARGLKIRFLTADLLAAADLGPFDYIDCCGVLHHLSDPSAGFNALSDALAPDGGIGLMVYAPYGRSGVYPLQAAFDALCPDVDPAEKVLFARAALDCIPQAHPFKRNKVLGDHRTSDAGFHDLLLHARDRAYTVASLLGALETAGLGVAGWIESARYDPMLYLPAQPELEARVKALSDVDRLTVAEQLSGTIKFHVCYAVKADRSDKAAARPTKPELIPHLSGIRAGDLAKHIERHGRVTADFDGSPATLKVPRDAARHVARIDGQKSLAEIAGRTDWLAFSALWGPFSRAMTGFNLMHYSQRAHR